MATNDLHTGSDKSKSGSILPSPTGDAISTASKSGHRRACEPCRKVKVQCTFETPKSTECRRCTKTERRCVIAARRPRHVASHNTISDLEKKVEALTKSLQDMSAKSASDVIDKDILNESAVSLEDATRCYRHFTKHMLPHMPIISIPPDLSAAEMRMKKPVLFLAIINAASGLLPLVVQQRVNQTLSRILAEKVLVEGEKSIELIQAMQLSCIWNYPPGRFEGLKFYQVIHSAAIMAIDLGLSRKRVIATPKSVSGLDEQSNSRLPDPTTAEARRAWVTCFYLASGTAQNFRRLNIIRWSSYLVDCLHYLENSPEALPSDKFLCVWVRLQHVSDDVSIRLSIEDAGACAGLDDPAIQYCMKGLETHLESVSSMPFEEMSAPLKLGTLLTKLYMHEVALHSGFAEESDMQPPFTQEALRSIRPTQAGKLSAAHIESLSTVVATVHAAFDVFLSISTETLRELPTFHFVRLVYAAIVVVKLAMDTTVSGSEIGRMFSLGDLKVDEYLIKLVACLNQAAEEDQCRNATKFGVVLSMIRLLYSKNVLKDDCGHGTDKSGIGFEDGSSKNIDETQASQNAAPTTLNGHGEPDSFECLQSWTGQTCHSLSSAPTFLETNTQPQMFTGQDLGQEFIPDLEIWQNFLTFEDINVRFGGYMNDLNVFLDGNGFGGNSVPH